MLYPWAWLWCHICDIWLYWYSVSWRSDM